jgi:hypothetical protein
MRPVLERLDEAAAEADGHRGAGQPFRLELLQVVQQGFELLGVPHHQLVGPLRTRRRCRMDLPGPTTSVGTRTDYSVGPWDYLTCAARHLMAWSTRTTEEKYSVRKLYMFCTI